MQYLIWTFPALTVIAVIASGKGGTLAASLLGLGLTLGVTLCASPQAFGLSDAMTALGRGAWIGWVVVPYILGGLLFWRIAMPDDGMGGSFSTAPADHVARRRQLFGACFLIGPFAESATGFGVGIIGTMMVVRRLSLPTTSLLVFSLLSQSMILWGAMGSGAVVAAAFARTTPDQVVLNASVFQAAVLLCWLPIYWRLVDDVGLASGWRERGIEAAWLVVAIASVILATRLLGPEIAMLAAFGPLIVLRYLVDERPDRAAIVGAARRMAPFAILIAWLVLTRLFQPLKLVLQKTGSLQPFEGVPVWSPLYHAGTWLALVAVLTAATCGKIRSLGAEMRAVWRIGQLAVLTILVFSMMAELTAGSGIAASLASGTFQAFGKWAQLIIPQFSSIFGSLANSANAANGLFMASQVSLAGAAGLNVAATVGLQHAAALSLNMVSPVRISIVCGLAGTPGREHEIYRATLPFVIVSAILLLAASLLITLRII